MSFSLDEVAFLASGTFDHPELALNRATQLADVAFLRARYGHNARAVAELIQARRSGKFPDGAYTTWLADADAAQQATPPAVASHRARYLRDQGVELVHDVTCSIGTEGHALTQAGLTYLGSDLDPSRLAMAVRNVPAGWFLRADALRPVSTRGIILADPARRAGGRRISDPARLLPPLPHLLEAYLGREMVIKCAPGLDFSHWKGLVELVSVDGAVKEACLYTPALAGRPVCPPRSRDLARGCHFAGTGLPTRRAVMLSTGGSSAEVGIGTTGLNGFVRDVIDNADPAPDVDAAKPGRYIIDPDGAIVRAGLVRHYAAREGLWQLDEHIAYLSGDRLPAGRSGFEFMEAVPLKKLKATLAAYGCGSLEILIRGVDVNPDELRAKLKLKGNRPLAVVVARIGSSPVAHVCGPRVVSTED